MNTLDLFSPLQLGPLHLPNRLAMAPLTRTRAGKGNVPHELNATYYEQRASAGLLISEATQVTPEGQGYPNTPGIHSDEQVAGWRLVTDAVHAAGGRIYLQLWHVGRISHPSYQPNGQKPVSASAIAPEGKVRLANGEQVDYVVPRALETDEIAGVVQQYANGARNAKAAGFDGVEIHGANGYLIDQFLRDGSNQRSDQYGGSLENRVRFLNEVTAAVVDVWGAERVGLRLSPASGEGSKRDSNALATFTRAAEVANQHHLVYLHLAEYGIPEVTETLTPAIRQAFDNVLIVNGGYDKQSANELIGSGGADMVAFGRPYIANPDLAQRYELDAPLNEPNPATFYGGGAEGYTDYPALEAVAA